MTGEGVKFPGTAKISWFRCTLTYFVRFTYLFSYSNQFVLWLIGSLVFVFSLVCFKFICVHFATFHLTHIASGLAICVNISTLGWQKQQQSFDDSTTCGGPARLVSRLNWISTPPSSSLQPYTPARPERVQLEFVSSWTSSTSAIYGRLWALRGRTT